MLGREIDVVGEGMLRGGDGAKLADLGMRIGTPNWVMGSIMGLGGMDLRP